jgi:flagellin-like protein
MKFIKDKRAISGIITTVILIALVMAASLIVWGVIDSMIRDKMGKSEACFEVYEKISLNERYTCYNPSEGTFQFSVQVGDLEPEKLLIGIGQEAGTKTITLEKGANITGVKDYGEMDSEYGNAIDYGTSGNWGKTYIVNLSASGMYTGTPDYIQIIPIVKGHQCEPSDRIEKINTCQNF